MMQVSVTEHYVLVTWVSTPAAADWKLISQTITTIIKENNQKYK